MMVLLRTLATKQDLRLFEYHEQMKMPSAKPSFLECSNHPFGVVFYIFEECPQIYFNNSDYFAKMEKTFKSQKNTKDGTRTKQQNKRKDNVNLSKSKLLQYYQSNSDGLYGLIKYRKDLLLGNWIEWDSRIDWPWPIEETT